MRVRAAFLSLATLSALTTPLGAFNGHVVEEGPLVLFVDEVSMVTELSQARAFTAWATNRGAEQLSVKVRFTDLVDTTRCIGPAEHSLQIRAGTAESARFEFAIDPPAYSALYPLHVRAEFHSFGSAREAHAIRIFETRFVRSQAKTDEPLVLKDGGSLLLANYAPSGVSWQVRGGSLVESPAGWEGDDAETGTQATRGTVNRSGVSRKALQIHPPWRKGAGTVFLNYRVRLPETQPLRFTFFNAIRDTGSGEPPSDGITFRVRVGETLLYERHTDSKQWTESHADLSAYAGKEIVLQLESHPGPKFNTTCDSGFWGDPVIVSGPPPVVITSAQREALRGKVQAAIGSRRQETGVYIFDLGAGMRAAVAPGPNGITDAAIAFGSGEQCVVFDGLRVALWDQALGGEEGGLAVRKLEQEQVNGRLQLRHHFNGPDGGQILTAELWSTGPALKLKVSGEGRISDLSLRAADAKAKRVYYGHGYCIEDPQAFRAGGGGHNLSTSHVGFEFRDGPALLMACDTPPDYFQVDPATQVYSLHTHPDTTFTFVPSLKGAFDCAIKYRPLYDKKPAPAVAAKAGRFVFDMWGGRYEQDARLVERCFAYGLTNSLAIMHVWQRWGYDYRLPDIFPPLPSLGTLEDLQAFGRLCDSRGVPWGLHDNYIDIYPDATGFTYDAVTFTPEGTPRKAWFNEGRRAQSYQFRPDKVRPFLERNLKLMAPALKPTSSFVDVWTSINAFDYYDREGRFHSKMETLRAWGEGFALIRDTFGGGPATSEAGADQLIGWLDGADCQFMGLSAKPERFQNSVACKDWERVPWFDVVNHTRFSLHGAGYSDRYQGGSPRDLRGIESDDYISAEILTGHALMIDLRGMVRGAVRKYWLAQDFIESVAGAEIRDVHFDGGDMHRLDILWDNGARARVNRGTNDWSVDGRVLPPFGYLAQKGELQSSVERLTGDVVEQSRNGHIQYVNARGFMKDAPLAIRPEALSVDYLGDRRFRLIVKWNAEEPAPADLAVFQHISRQVPGYYSNVEFSGGGQPGLPTSRWRGPVITGTNWLMEVPMGFPLGESDILVGLYDNGARGRARLLGKEVPDRRYRIGRLSVQGSVSNGQTNITNIQLVRTQEADTPMLLANRSSVDFGPVKTLGGLRIIRENGSATAIPLPDGKSFEVELDTRKLGIPAASRVTVIDATGKDLSDMQSSMSDGKLSWTVKPEAFGYRIR